MLTGPKKMQPKGADNIKEENTSFKLLQFACFSLLFGIFAAVELSVEKPPTMKQTDKVGQAGPHANNRHRC